MTDMPETVTATFCATLVDEWVRCGVTDAVVAPGSRSTPLALALGSDERLRVHVHHDERAASFMALGFGAATGRPAPVLTTSGTAAVEMHPAVVEAHLSRVPMIACTADRPPELRDVGAPQTVDQNRLYGHAVRWFVDPGVPEAADAHMWRSLAARCVAEATGPPAGPVQLNLPFRDPLVGRPAALPDGRGTGAWHRPVGAPARLDGPALDGLAAELSGRRGVILAGRVPGGGLDPSAVHALARSLGWPVLAEPRSGCRVPVPTTISHADALLRVPAWSDAHPAEVVLQLGQPAASKVLGQWVASSGGRVITVDPDGWWFDPDRIAGTVLRADPSQLASDLAARTSPVDDAWSRSWADADRRAAAAIDGVLGGWAASEPGVAREVLAAAPDGGALVLASSMPVRDVEWYGAPRDGIRVMSNRGANGIDGVMSTAAGVALSGVPTTVLIGDVAFLHDTNALLGLADRDVDLVIVVVDNDGGGIFSFLPQADLLGAARFEQLFGTPHGVDVTALATAHGIPATVASTCGEVGDVIRKGGTALVVLRTERGANVALHDELHAAVAAALV